jgi:LmbE family N-acetylglucosaminyl deacetylase
VFPSAGTRLIFPELLAEGLAPHNVKRVFIHGADKPDVWIDIGETLEVKVRALKCHLSQLGDWDPTEEMTNWAREDGKERGILAEAFKVMVLEEEEPSEEKSSV